MSRRALLVAGTVVLLLPLLAEPFVADRVLAQTRDETCCDAAAELLGRGLRAAETVPYTGRLVVVTLGDGQPGVVELDVASGPDGLAVAGTTRWTVSTSGDEGVVWDAAGVGGLRLGHRERLPLDVDRLAATYDLSLSGEVRLATGPARVLQVAERGRDVDRERIFVDEATGMVVRRESFDAQGEAVRLVAFTALTPTADGLPAQSVRRGPAPVRTEAEEVGPRPLDDAGLAALSATGWFAPRTLAPGFVLDAGYAVDTAADSALHLLYRDGLYTVSVYEQMGSLDAGTLVGAEPVRVGDAVAWRWPGSTPERMVWSGGGVTFTAVADAPPDVLARTVAGLPNDARPNLRQRLGHGLGRVASWVWPFG